MKKSLIALAVLAFAGAASAQSSVTLFGVVDTNLQHGSGSVANKTALGNSGIASSQLGFRGVEDLGGGMSASFWFEMGVNTDDGSGQGTNTNNQVSGNSPAGFAGGQGLTMNRRMTVSLGGAWGEVRLGRDYTPMFRAMTIYDPFGTNGVGTSQALNSQATGTANNQTRVRASNSIAYHYNTGGFTGGPGIYGAAAYWLGENASNTALPTGTNDGKGWGARIGYASGPFDVSVASGKTRYAAGNVKMSNIGASWNFGMAKLMGEYSADKYGTVAGKGGVVGVQVPVGPGEIRLAYSRYRLDTGADPATKKLALGYVHNLSKRTALYATYARVRNSGGATQALNGASTAANGSSTGYDLGVKHAF